MTRAARDLALVIVAMAVLTHALVAWLRPDTGGTALAANAHKASLALLDQRRVTDSVTDQAQALATANRTLRSRVAALGGDLRGALDSADAVLRDSLASNVQLRLTLAEVVDKSRLYADSTDVLLAHLAVMDSAATRERAAWIAERAAADTLIAAERARADHWQRRATCRVGPIPCPSRTTLAALLLFSLAL